MHGTMFLTGIRTQGFVEFKPCHAISVDPIISHWLPFAPGESVLEGLIQSILKAMLCFSSEKTHISSAHSPLKKSHFTSHQKNICF